MHTHPIISMPIKHISATENLSYFTAVVVVVDVVVVARIAFCCWNCILSLSELIICYPICLFVRSLITHVLLHKFVALTSCWECFEYCVVFFFHRSVYISLRTICVELMKRPEIVKQICFTSNQSMVIHVCAYFECWTYDNGIIKSLDPFYLAQSKF